MANAPGYAKPERVRGTAVSRPPVRLGSWSLYSNSRFAGYVPLLSLHDVELNLRLVVAAAAQGEVELMNLPTVESRISDWPLG